MTDPTHPRFESAVDAVVAGDLEGLKQLLHQAPGLVHTRSARPHQATLLHYTAANGVEAERQKTPANVVAIADLLLKSGAEVDAEANLYGAGSTTLALAATSAHPERAGVQLELLAKLLEYDAKINHPIPDPVSISAVKSCLANGRLAAATYLANESMKQGNSLDLADAAGVGLLGELAGFFDDSGKLRSSANRDQVREGFLYACQFGHAPVVEFLLQHGAQVSDADSHGQTGLHWAAIGGHLDLLALLLKHSPSLETHNSYGSTAFEQTLWSAAHDSRPQSATRYVAVLEILAEAGSSIPERHAPVNPVIDAWLAHHGSRAEREWNWDQE